jgi:hypothetical protein
MFAFSNNTMVVMIEEGFAPINYYPSVWGKCIGLCKADNNV